MQDKWWIISHYSSSSQDNELAPSHLQKGDQLVVLLKFIVTIETKKLWI